MTDTPEMIRQRAYRKRRTAKIERLETGHRNILDELDGNAKPLAVKLRTIALEALGEAK